MTPRNIRQTPRTPGFYLLLKIHKTGNPGQPTVSSNNDPTEATSEFTDYHLRPLVAQKSTIPQTCEKLSTLDELPDGTILVTLDVTSWCANIPHEEGLAEALDSRRTRRVPTEDICNLIQLILKKNKFKFNDQYYTRYGEGHKHGAILANLYIDKWDRSCLDTQNNKPLGFGGNMYSQYGHLVKSFFKHR